MHADLSICADSANRAQPARDTAPRGRRNGRRRSRQLRRGCSCSSPPGIRRPVASQVSWMALNRYQAIARRTGLPRLTQWMRPSVRAILGDADQLPTSSPIAALVSGRARSRRQDRRRVRGARPAMVRPHLANRSVALLPGSLDRRRLSTSVLIRYVKAALARAPEPASAAAVNQDLAGSPPLAALTSRQTSCWVASPRSPPRIRELHGYRIVINAWAPSCGPCRSEFRSVRLGLCPVRAPGHVPRGRHRRGRRRRAHVPR